MRIWALCVVASAACRPAAPVPPPVPVPASSAAAEEHELARAVDVFALPPTEQSQHLRRWAASAGERRELALRHLAWRHDDQAVALSIAALESDDPKTRRVAAQALAELAPGGPAAIEALRRASERAVSIDRPAILWARIIHGDATATTALRTALPELVEVRGLRGERVFSAERLAAILPASEARELAVIEEPKTRAVVADVLGVHGDMADVPRLREWLDDEGVVESAAGALARIDHPDARDALRRALEVKGANARAIITGIAERAGGAALVGMLEASPGDEAAAWHLKKIVFEALERLADPRAGDALTRWAAGAHHPHWQAEAGIALAVIGDLRAAPLLGARLKLDPARIYDSQAHYQSDAGGHLSKGDLQRVVASRLLADLVALHPASRETIAAATLGPLLAWTKATQHANGMRALSRIGGAKEVALLRAWAFPADPLPEEGAMPPFPRAFETAQSALRYVGATRDAQSRGPLLAQFRRNADPELDITQEGLMGAGIAMRGMALRAIGFGAANGLSEWGPSAGAEAIEALLAFVEGRKWHEEARLSACEALPWVDGAKEALPRIAALGASDDEADRFIAACLAGGLAARPPEASAIADLLLAGPQPEVQWALARALGAAGVGPDLAPRLFAALESEALRGPVALSLLLGGSPFDAQRVVVTLPPDALEVLKDHWYLSFGRITEEDLGRLARWVKNAEAIGALGSEEAPTDWALERLRAALASVFFDNGPHSLTRVTLVYRLLDAARGGNAEAVAVLGALGARGSLMSLVESPLGREAERALNDLDRATAEDPAG